MDVPCIHLAVADGTETLFYLGAKVNVGGHIGKNQHWKTQEKSADCLNSQVFKRAYQDQELNSS